MLKKQVHLLMISRALFAKIIYIFEKPRPEGGEKFGVLGVENDGFLSQNRCENQAFFQDLGPFWGAENVGFPFGE